MAKPSDLLGKAGAGGFSSPASKPKTPVDVSMPPEDAKDSPATGKPARGSGPQPKSGPRAGGGGSAPTTVRPKV